MLQVRKLVLAVAAATSMASGMAHALGLGEVSVKSALNEPLVAEIELLDARGLSAEDIRSRLASPEDFSRAGVDRQFFLNNLKFTPVVGSNGKSFVRVTSNQAVREPFLNFLLEVYWPAGRVLKEYTLLLDPPMYTPQELVYRSAPVTAPVASQAPVRPASAVAPARRQPVAAATAAPALQGDQYRVQQNDTLWEIALRANRGGGSVHQVMLAIQDLNPDAFIDGNINRLKTGQVLKLPDAGQITRRSRSQAAMEFQGQVDAWRSGGPVERQLDARRRETAAAAPARAEQGDSLRLVAAETGEASTGSDSGVSGKAVNDQLAQTREQLDSALLQNEDLSSRVEELNSQVEKLQRLLELKNTQLANLQNMTDEELDAAVAASEETAGEAVETVTEEVAGQDAVALPEQVEAGAAEDQQEAVEPETTQEAADEVASVAETTEETAVAVQAVVEEPARPAEPVTAPAAPKPASVAFEPPPEPKGFVDELMENPLFLPGAGAGVALLLLLLLVSRRNKAKQEELAADQFDEQGPGTAFAGHQELDEDLDVLDGVLDDLAGELEEPTEFIDVPATAESAVSDPVTEAENYISFGRFNQAADVLLKAIDADPQREELRFKLLEVYADLEDRNAFLQQVDELNAMGVSQVKLDELRQRFPHLMGEDEGGLSLDDIMLDLPDLTGDAASSPAGDSDILADDIPGLDDLLAVSDVAEDSGDEQDELSSLLDAVGTELDADMGIDFEPVSPAADAVADAAGSVAEDFELPDLEDIKLDDLDLPSIEEPDSLSLTDDLKLEDLQFEDFEARDGIGAEQPADASAMDFDLDLDLSFPLEDATEQGLTELETGALEAGLETLETGFDELQNEVHAVLQGNDDPLQEPALAIEPEVELAGGFDLATPELAEGASAGDEVLAELAEELDDDFSFLQGDDEDKTKLDLASALTDMGDIEGARDILDEVIREGAPEHREQARELLARLG